MKGYTKKTSNVLTKKNKKKTFIVYTKCVNKKPIKQNTIGGDACQNSKLTTNLNKLVQQGRTKVG